MSIIIDEVVASGPVPETLHALFTKGEAPDIIREHPGKRRKLDEAQPSYEDIAANLLSSYLTVARFDLKIRFSSSSLSSGSISSKRGSDNQRKVPVFIKRARFVGTSFESSARQCHLRIATNQRDIVLDKTLDCSTCRIDLAIPGFLPSIYRSRSKFPVACYMSTLRKAESDELSFILETKILWKDSIKFERISNDALLPFSRYLPQNPQEPPVKTQFSHGRSIKECSWSPSEFYESVHVPLKTLDLPSSALSNSLQCQLFPFQRRAVRWMLEREGMEILPDGEIRVRPPSLSPGLPDSFEQIKDADGRTCYASHLFRILTTDLRNWIPVERTLRGGILAEDMGLGKTVEIIALICMNRRPAPPGGFPVLRQWPTLTESGATLIVTPPTILKQWQQEISSHAPSLRCIYYEGLNRTKMGNEELVVDLASCDVVLTTYNVLQREVHFAEEPPKRSLRHKKKVLPRKSPLVQISWWRVCIDEAQMIESRVTNAAKVARIIPRHNAWAVTGTPLRKDMDDVLGLLLFLHYYPLCNSLDTWIRLYGNHKSLFKTIIGRIVLRHNKTMVRDELHLPPQKRIVITIPFTAVEEQHYDQLFEQMCDECGVDRSGAPSTDEWDPDSKSLIEKMSHWLRRLRQACLHPELGGDGRKTLGANSGPLRSVAEVLEVMIDQNEARIRTEERSLLLSQIRRGQLLENAGRPREALNIWQKALVLAETNVHESRTQLENERKKEQSAKLNGVHNISDDEDDIDEGKGEKNSGLGAYRLRIRNALEIQHICKFFIANAYFQIKTNTELTNPDSEEFIALEKLEEENYEAAKLIRKDMLAEMDRRVNRYIKQVQVKVYNNDLVHIPKMSVRLDISGMESRRILDKLENFCDAVNNLTLQYTKWRNHIVKLLLKPLIDEDDNAKLEGDEYESSTKHQDEMYVYMEALQTLFADYHDALTGQTNLLVANEVKLGLNRARDGNGPAPELYISVMKMRENLKIPKDLGSLRGIIGELRSLMVSIEWQEARGSARAHAELGILNRILQDSSQTSSEHSKISSNLEKEVELFRNLLNHRLEYYRQLQHISDTVAPYDEESRGKPLNVALFDSKLEFEHNIQAKISAFKSKYRYLIHLRDEAGADESTRICIICQSTFEIGVLTVCGHKYCKDCLRFWWRQHRTCPMCKIHLKSNDFHQITYKPTELVAQEEKSTDHFVPDNLTKNSIYSDISSGVLKEIRNIEIGGSFGTKVDNLARHLIWLRQHDPGAKSIVFSQYKPFLGILARAFSHFKIGFSSIDYHDGTERFKRDPSIECFLLHAKAHSSGLNLVNATHVFLCEPLINTAIELQAIARVHRIGQHRETTVWMYLVSDSVEESIYDISVSRRLDHISRKRKEEENAYNHVSRMGEGEETTSESMETVIEAANSLELQDANLGNLMAGTAAEGERVPEGDLWQCLFAKTSRGKSTGNGGNTEALQNEVNRLLRAEAAEGRIEEAVNGEVLTNGDTSADL
ncbi:uncharacterized protein PADG_03952 [Paracoccidioides brasiliensis Pb18]|uniref:RING-type domain-containing protein n=1 Tax=Paracoccidioides brasiliensis (strain Pb18) TaxID=502780 RepID=C1G9L6_PARBD|nr:uncharacterized protein PADG_03952 [Paracoccidioides brasiliensis Pb18]EEH47868.2 hypothetical protein PADG_03952 [Paracoccidioides brasiliensis Pb18]